MRSLCLFIIGMPAVTVLTAVATLVGLLALVVIGPAIFYVMRGGRLS